MDKKISIEQLRRRDRDFAWRWAHGFCHHDSSDWQVEIMKSALSKAENNPGWFGRVSFKRRPFLSCILLKLRTAFAAIIALMALTLWTIRFGSARNSSLSLSTPRNIVAIHAELSTRTQHVLRAVKVGDLKIDAILLIGRVRKSKSAIASVFADELSPVPLPPIVIPVSFSAALAALKKIPALISQGMKDISKSPVSLSMRDLIAISFRVFHGAVVSQWWDTSNVRGANAWFGITGTADTLMLERAIQKSENKTIHVVHGQAIGPNFLAFSDVAVFRSGYDANNYSKLGCYGQCVSQPSERKVSNKRASSGLLLITNLAHPMNAGYQKFGVADEILTIENVSRAARKLGVPRDRLFWKPHPTTWSLCKSDVSTLQEAAQELGFKVLQPHVSHEYFGTTCRWVVATPSTAMLDLLVEGVLCVLLDPQGTSSGTALSNFPRADISSFDGLVTKLSALAKDEEYENVLRSTFLKVSPSRPFDFDVI